ncbi:MAG TPA: hypothetical protein VGQ11_08610 [Candidatus Acidoferrales bacterium]|jgi:hypothetical protein|nr:hypothetical protein [Candidatus Acidoferrales bacterium]
MSAPAELREIARHVVWFKPPEQTLSNIDFFLGYLMAHGTYEEVKTAEKYFSKDDFRRALEHAPPGVFPARAWAYWNTILGRVPVPEMPRRRFQRS